MTNTNFSLNKKSENENLENNRSPSGSDFSDLSDHELLPSLNEDLMFREHINFSLVSDDRLYRLCAHYGEQARKWRQKFAGLLPEANKRRLYEKKGFSSIFEFAKKLAGMTEEHVRRVLNIDKNFEDKPILQSLLRNGEVSVNKLARITSIATQENQEFLASQVQLLPKSAVETLVRDEKIANLQKTSTETFDQQNLFSNVDEINADMENRNGFGEPQSGDKSVPGHRFRSNDNKSSKNQPVELQLSDEVKQKLLELQQKGIDINELFMEFLEKREIEIAVRKEKLSKEAKETNSRYINVETKKLLKDDQGKKCSVKGCTNDAVEIHHTLPFSIGKIHDPKLLAQLCKQHHEIAHSVNRKFHLYRNNLLLQKTNR